MILKFILAYILCGILWTAYFWNCAKADGRLGAYLNNFEHTYALDHPTFSLSEINMIMKLIQCVGFVCMVLIWPRMVFRLIVSLLVK